MIMLVGKSVKSIFIPQPRPLADGVSVVTVPIIVPAEFTKQTLGLEPSSNVKDLIDNVTSISASENLKKLLYK